MIENMMRRAGATALFAFAALLFVASPAAAQVVFDAASNASPATNSAATSFTVSWTHVVGSAKKPYLVVQVAIDRNGNNGQTVTGVVWAQESVGQPPNKTTPGAPTE